MDVNPNLVPCVSDQSPIYQLTYLHWLHWLHHDLVVTLEVSFCIYMKQMWEESKQNWCTAPVICHHFFTFSSWSFSEIRMKVIRVRHAILEHDVWVKTIWSWSSRKVSVPKYRVKVARWRSTNTTINLHYIWYLETAYTELSECLQWIWLNFAF